MRDLFKFTPAELLIIDGDIHKKVNCFIQEQTNRNLHVIKTDDGRVAHYVLADSNRCDGTVEAINIVTDDDEIMEMTVDVFHIDQDKQIASLATNIANNIEEILGYVPTDEKELLEAITSTTVDVLKKRAELLAAK